MCNGDHKGTKTFEVAVVRVVLFKELDLDHVAVVAV